MKGQLCMFIALIYTIFSAGNAFQSQLVFGTFKALSVLDLDVKNVTVINNYPNNETVFYIARHEKLCLIYWTVGYKLYRSRFASLPTFPELIIEDEIIGIAIDDVNNHLYWCSSFNNTIKRSELDGSDTRIIIDEMGQPYFIALDLLNGWIFYSLVDNNTVSNSGIYKCKLNGSNRQTVVPFALILGLVLDIPENRMYWTDAVYGDVRSAKLDGSNVTIILQRDSAYFFSWGIDINENYLYVSYFYLYGKIIRVDKVTGSNPVTLLESNNGIFAVKLCNCEAAPTTAAPPTTSQPPTWPPTTGPPTTGTTTTGPPPTTGTPTTGIPPTTAPPATVEPPATRPSTTGAIPTTGAPTTTGPTVETQPTKAPPTTVPTTTGATSTTDSPTNGPTTTTGLYSTTLLTTSTSVSTTSPTTDPAPTTGAPPTTAPTITGTPTTGPPTTGSTTGTQPTTTPQTGPTTTDATSTTATLTTGPGPTAGQPSTTPPTTSSSNTASAALTFDTTGLTPIGSTNTTTSTVPPPTTGPPTTGIPPTTAQQTTVAPPAASLSTTGAIPTTGVPPTTGLTVATQPTTAPPTTGPTTTGATSTTDSPTYGPASTIGLLSITLLTTSTSVLTTSPTTGPAPTTGAPPTTAPTITGTPTSGPPTTGSIPGTQSTTTPQTGPITTGATSTTASLTTGPAPTTELPSTTQPTTSTSVFNTTSASFPNDTVSVIVTTELIHGPSENTSGHEPTPSLLPVFKCTTNDVSNGTYVYDVYWYINGYNVTVHKNVPYHSLNTTHLRTEDWSNTFKMNMKVTCAIRLRYRLGSIPGPFLHSSEFLAGLFPTKNEYIVTEGDSVNISFTATVPVACNTSNPNVRRKICELNINLFQPKQADKKACSNNIASRDILFKTNFCGIKIGSFDWNETKTVQVYGYSDGIYNQRHRSTYIRLSTSAVPISNDFWKEIWVPDIKVTIIDKDSILANRLCQSYNDPHITTFDGRYYDYMEVGEFVMYRNDRGPYWVHTLLTSCGFGAPGSACHCGIAIRSRNSLFVLRTCKKISRRQKYLLQQPLVKLITCAGKDLFIDHTGPSYKITLPIGTSITFKINTDSKFISVISITPSIYDITEAKGLCGVPSTTRDPSDDFAHRTQGPIQNSQTFADSWRSLKSEQLFISEPEFFNASYVANTTNTEDNNSTRFCNCERDSSVVEFPDLNNAQCNLTDSTEYCSLDLQSTHNKVSAFYTSCSVKSSTNDNDDVWDFQPLTYDQDVNEIVVPQTFRNGWTAEKARHTCLETIRNATPSYLYDDFVDLKDEHFIQSCIMDIELTGDTTFLSDTIGTMVFQITTEVSKNESLYFIETGNGSQTLLEYITSFLCPNNCSLKGNCTLGVCSCTEGYAGDDCSKSLSTPPSNLSLPVNGLCTLSTRPCVRTNIYGDFPSTNVWAKINYFEIKNVSFRLHLREDVVRADYRNMFMVSVRLGSSRRKRSAAKTKTAEGYEIRLSNDGVYFGDSVTIIIYDDNCYTCNGTTSTCIDLVVCKPSISNTTNDNVRAIVGSVVSVIVIIVLLVCGVIYYKFKKSPKKVQIDNNSKDVSESSLPDIPVPTMHGWVKENTVHDLQRKIDENLKNTTIEIAEKNPPTCMHSAAFDFQNDDNLQLPDKSPAHAWINKGNTVRDMWMNKEYTVSDLKLSVEERTNTAINLFEEEAPHENQSASVHTVTYGVKQNELQPSDKPAAHAWVKKENTASDLCMNKEYTVSDLKVCVEERSSTAIELFEDEAPEKNRPTSVHIAGSDVQNDEKLQFPNIRLVHAWMNKEITASDLKLRFEERSNTTGELFEYENPSINNFKEF